MKARDLRTMLAFMRLLPDSALDVIADARFTFEPRDSLDRVLLQIAAGEREWRAECKTAE